MIEKVCSHSPLTGPSRQLDAKTKQPYAFGLKDAAPFAFAGLWGCLYGQRLKKSLAGAYPILYQFSRTDGTLLSENDMHKDQAAD